MIARRAKNHAHFLRTRADTRTLALLPRVFYCYISGFPIELLWMIEVAVFFFFHFISFISATFHFQLNTNEEYKFQIYYNQIKFTNNNFVTWIELKS